MCAMCIKIYGRFVCPKLTRYGTPLPDKNPRSRQDLAMQLAHADYYE